MRTSRRDALKTIGGLGTLLLLDCSTSTTPGFGSDAGAGDVCVLDPSLTKGPYWVDEKLNRVDVTGDTHNLASPNPRPGLPLVLRFTVLSVDGGVCTALPGAQVDLWHCDASGVYSDSAGMMGGGNTVGQNFLRGYQVSDADGKVQFSTIYPGWYVGRTVHIHVKVRLFDSTQNSTTEATTQLFFDDAVNDAVFKTAAPYNARGARDTRNAADSIYDNTTELLLSLTGDAATSFVGSAALGVKLGSISAG